MLCCPNQIGMETTELEGALQVLSFAMVRSNGIIYIIVMFKKLLNQQ